MSPNKPTILLVPSEGDPHGLLAPGKAGAMPPIMHYRPSIHAMIYNPTGSGWAWCEGRNTAALSLTHALVLALDGEPVPEGMARLLLVTIDAMKSAVPDGLCVAMTPTYWIDREEIGDSEFGGAPTYPVAVCIGTDGVFWRLDLPDDAPDTNDTLIVLAAVASRLNARVIVLGGSDADR